MPETPHDQDGLEGVDIREGMEGLSTGRIRTLYRRAPILRPIDSERDVQTMFENASLILTAWYEEELVGIARVLTDEVLYSYLCDLAVDPDVQRLGIGKALVEEVLARCEGTEVVLRASSDLSSSFYEHMGFKRVDNAWVVEAT